MTDALDRDALVAMLERIWHFPVPDSSERAAQYSQAAKDAATALSTLSARAEAAEARVKALEEKTGPWCQPMDCGKHTPRKFIVRFEDAERGDAVFDDEAEARAFWERANASWNCYLFGSLPLVASKEDAA